LEAERQQFEVSKINEFRRGIAREVEQDGEKQVDILLDRFSGNPLPSEAKTRLKGVITFELDTALRRDSNFLQKRDRLLAEGNRNKIFATYKAEVGKLLPEIVKRVHREFYGTAKSVLRTSTDRGMGKAGHPNQQPNPGEIDWTRTSRSAVLDGKAYVKGRAEQVTW
jgi:hypothetical protein